MSSESGSKTNQHINGRGLFLLLGFVLAAACVRLLPHPPNLLPTTAMTIFAGCQFPSLLIGGLVVLASLLLSDILLGFHSTMPFVYLALMLILLAAHKLHGRRFNHLGNLLALLGVTLGSSIFFFFFTNLGVFLMQDLYPKTAAGLVLCYTAALPFFENSLLSDFLYVSLLFAGWEMLCAGKAVIFSGPQSRDGALISSR